MGTQPKVKTAEELREIFAKDPDLMLDIVAKIMSTRVPDMEKILKAHRDYNRRRKLQSVSS